MATWDRYKNRITGLELRSRTGSIFYPRSYCDDPTIGPVNIYVKKAPVCKLKVTPVTQFTSVAINWDISQSRSATSTIGTFDISFDDGGAGDLSGQDWSTDPKTGTKSYSSTGKYVITASVTDLIGTESEEVQVEVNIVQYVALQRCYVFTTDGGLFILTPSGGPTAANPGLTGNHTNMRAGHVHPAYADLPVAQQHLWAATQDGVAYTVDGAANWTPVSKATLGTPANDAGDSPAPATADLDQIDLAFDPQDPDRIYVTRTTISPERTWVYVSDDYGETWSNVQVSA